MRYRAFISYSRQDRRIAKKVHRALEQYRAPKGIDTGNKNRTLGRFFKDDDELAGAEGLGAALDGAIDDSAILIVVASPHSARSKWVNREVIRFKQKSYKRVLALIVSGVPNSIDEKMECFAPALRYELDSNGHIGGEPADPPLAPSVTEEGFSRAFTRLVAGILDIPFDSLWRREKRRRLQRLLLICLTSVIFTIGLAIYYSTTEEYGVVYTDLGRISAKDIKPATGVHSGVAFFASLEKDSFWSDEAGHEGYDTTVDIHAIDDQGRSIGRLRLSLDDVGEEYGDREMFGVFESTSAESISSLVSSFGYYKEEERELIEKKSEFTLPPDNQEKEYGRKILPHRFDENRVIQIIGNDHTSPSIVYASIDNGKSWSRTEEFSFHLGKAFIWSGDLPNGSIFIGSPEDIDPYNVSTSGLYITTDHGESWSPVEPVHGNWNSLEQFGGNPTNPRFLAVELGLPKKNNQIDQAGLWLTRNGGESWVPAGYQGTENDISALLVTNAGDLVAIVNHSLVRYAKRSFFDRIFQRYDLVTTGSSLSED
jgi:hypothetical protein